MNKYRDEIPRLESEIMLSSILRCKRSELYINEVLSDRDAEAAYESFVSRRLTGEPVQYIVGSAEFMGLDLIVNKDVFIPRPETELLVDNVLHYTSHITHYTRGALKILDLCTGSGNIAISIAKLIDDARVTATDISDAALRVARRNSDRHNIGDRIEFYKGDLFEALPRSKRCIHEATDKSLERGLPLDKMSKFDIIVCNPPYIKKQDIAFLQQEVRKEPLIALDGGDDGLDFYRTIAEKAFQYLEKNGSMFLEIGIGQAGDIRGIFEAAGRYRIRSITKDFSGIDRILWISLL